MSTPSRPLGPIARLLADPPDLPVAAALADVVAAVREHGVAVVHAPPGTGKTTLVPPSMALDRPGRVVVTQPRRIAARAAARRLAELIGEDVGRTVGFSVRGEARVSAATRVEFVTTGSLVRRLQRDAELPGVGTVVLDEVHERHLDDDLALALLVDVRRNLRDDLAVVAMSATVEAERTARVLGDAAPSSVIGVSSRLFPVEAVWCPPRSLPFDERGVTQGFLDHVADVVRRAVRERDGDVLVFLPGVREVDGVARRLGGLIGGDGADAARVDVLRLHGRLPAAEQDRALRAGSRRRVVVSTAVAESSLTVPGVRTVVDAGLSREPRTDQRRGLAGLVTVRVSRAAAEQRAGRAGRQGPGAVYRCWSEADQARLVAHPAPEITTADLTAFALELACWGSEDGRDLTWLDAPPAAAMASAREILRELGALDARGSVADRGRRMAGIGVDPRLARALLDGAGRIGADRACEIVALLDLDERAPGADLAASLRAVRHGGRATEAWRRQVDRLRHSVTHESQGRSVPRAGSGGAVRSGTGPLTDDLAVGLVAALAHPDRVARLRPGGSTYLMASGTGAVLPQGSPLTGAAWLAIADADRAPGRRDAVIRAAAPIDLETAVEAMASGPGMEDVVAWRDRRVVARRRRILGAIELADEPLKNPAPELVRAAVRDGIGQEGLDALRWSDAAVRLRARLAFLHGALGAPWPDVGDEALLADLDSWLAPGLERVRRVGDLARVDVLAALRRLLPWPDAARLDELAPERVALLRGRTARVDYGAEQPVVAVRIQEAFGWERVPLLAGGRVPVLLHLLSPAGRPAAVTSDLESFWHGGYASVRSDLRGRYPKHAWPKDPLHPDA